MKDSIFTKLRDWATERNLDKIPFSKVGHSQNIIEEAHEAFGYSKEVCREEAKRIVSDMDEFGKEVSEHDVIDSIADQIVFGFTSLVQLGYDVEKVLEQTWLEVNSRSGEWVESEKKWCKFETPEAKAKWVKADYSKCKYIEPEESDTITHVNGLKENDSCFYIESNDAKKFLRLYRQIDSEQYLQITDVQSVVVDGNSYVGLYK